jgi:hypothetical protein
LERVGDAGLHALAAANASPQEFFLGNGSRRTNDLLLAQSGGKRSPVDKKSSRQASSERIKKAPPGKINGGIFSAQLMGPDGRGQGGKGDGLFGTDLGASPALDAFGQTGFFRVLLNGFHGTASYTLETFIAFRAYPAFEKSQGGYQAQQRPEGTEVTAPETGSNPVQSDDPGKDQESEEGHVENRLSVVLVRKVHPAQGLSQGAEYVQKKVYQGNDQRIEKESVKASQEWEWVQEIGQSQTGGGRAEEQDEENKFNSPPGQFFFQAGADLLGPEERVEKIDGCAHGTDVGAKKSSDNQGSPDKEKRPKGAADDLPSRQNGTQSQKGIQAKIDIRWEPFRELVVGKGEEEEGEDK